MTGRRMTSMVDSVDWQLVACEAKEHLIKLIRIPTVGGAGRETEAALYLKEIVAAEGLNCEIAGGRRGKGNFVVRLPGEEGGRCEDLLLLAHLDVAPAGNLDEWEVPPFAGAERQGEVWGRGAFDCKGLVVTFLAVTLLVHRMGMRLRRGITFAATADEEQGGKWGIAWLLGHRPDLVRCRYAIGEGGGFPVRREERVVYTCQVAEKGKVSMYIRTRPDRAARRVRLPKKVLIPARNRMFPRESWRGCGDQVDLEHLLNHVFVVRTVANQTEPETDLLAVEGWVVPGYPVARVVDDFLCVLAWHGIESTGVEVLEVHEPTRSSDDTPLFGQITRSVRDLVAGAEVVPFMTPGRSDGEHLRRAGVDTYGFFPVRSTDVVARQHRPNERLPVADLAFAARVLFSIITGFCGMAPKPLGQVREEQGYEGFMSDDQVRTVPPREAVPTRLVPMSGRRSKYGVLRSKYRV